jgi:hypothetical protein
VGIRPHTTPDPKDVALLADAAQGQRELLALLDHVVREHGDSGLYDLRSVLTEQLAAVSNDPESPSSPYPTVAPGIPSGGDQLFTSFAQRVEAVAAARAKGAASAGAVDVTKVLAAMAAGLDQVAVAARELA